MPSHDTATRGTTIAATAAALFLLLVAPFIVFLERHHYSLLNPEIALCLAVAGALVLAIAGLARWPMLRVLAIALAASFAFDAQFDQYGLREQAAVALLVSAVGWVLRDHLARVVTITGLAFVISTVALAGSFRQAPPALAGGNDRLPFVLHVVLDEHGSVEDLPRGAAFDAPIAKVTSFFDRHHFRQFTDAYSEYFFTRYSLSQMLNFSNGHYTPGVFRADGSDSFELVQNKFFSRVAAEGYSINVFQSTHLDVCANQRVVARCETYDYAGIRELQYSGLDVLSRLYAVGVAYARRFTLYNKARRTGGFIRKHAQQRWLPDRFAGAIRGMPLVFRAAPSEHYGPVATRAETDRLIAAVSGARGGQYVFAHLMLPHYPYVYLPDCSFRPVAEWQARTDSEAPPRTSNTPEGRQTRYRQYLDQLQCLYRDLDRLLNAIPTRLQRDAVVILHGDHGSRITLVDPDASSKRALTSADFADSYSTLLAVKAPAVPAGDDARVVAVGCVLSAVVESAFATASPDPSCNAAHTVFKVPRQSAVIAKTAAAVTYVP